MKQKLPFFLMIISLASCFLCACQNPQTTSSEQQGDTLEMKHARLLQIITYKDYTVATIQNPWKEGEALKKYILIDKDQKVAHLPEGTIVPIPLEKAVIYSSVHASLLQQLDLLQAINGVCDASFFLNPKIQEGLRNKSIQDYGNSMNPNLEQILEQMPDALMPSPYENSGSHGKLAQLGIPIIECADYMEKTALGRAEWMRFYGLLFGKGAKADSLFQEVEKEYRRLQQLAQKATQKPKLICEMKTGANWFVPGGNSTSGQLYQDAGADYLFAHLKESGATALSFEAVLEQGENADIWLIKYNQKNDLTYQQMAKDYPPYRRFKAWKEKNIYGCNTNQVPFYEETPFQPHLLLQELIRIFHPELLPHEPNRYFKKLQ